MEDRELSISITTGTVIKAVCILAAAWLIFFLRDVVLIVLTAVVIASALEPGVRALVRRRIPRVVAVLAIYALMIGAFFVLFYSFFPSVLKDFATFASSLPTYLDTFAHSEAVDTYTNILGLPSPASISTADFMDGFRGIFNFGASSAGPLNAAGRILGGLLSFILIMVFSFYFALQETGVDDFLRIVAPKKHQSYVQDLWRRSQHKIGLWMQGQLVLAVLIAVLVYLSLTILGVPHALVLALIAGLFELIPVFGPILAAVPAVIIGFVSGGAFFGLVIAGVYMLIQQFENHLIYPQVVTRVVGVPPLLVILALIIGAELAGALGVILSVPVAATLQELVKDFERGRLAEHTS
ncbi:AI-2E family transporter [Candidatus Kaiserbacteria bacterium]|nr:AI-2E family transporter [Candidatus Kaiserbacteria bacterium]